MKAQVTIKVTYFGGRTEMFDYDIDTGTFNQHPTRVALFRAITENQGQIKSLEVTRHERIEE